MLINVLNDIKVSMEPNHIECQRCLYFIIFIFNINDGYSVHIAIILSRYFIVILKRNINSI